MTESTVHLVQYGRPGFLGRFRGSHALSRGDRVLIRSPRGLELAEVLLPGDSRQADDDGDVLRAASPEDDLELEDLNRRGQDLLASAMVRAEATALPLAFVDVEVTLDGVAVLHALPWAECDATGLLDSLAEASGLVVRLLDLSHGPRPAANSTGCGKPGCGSEGGGCSSCGSNCSSGSCSRGAIKSPEEMTTYFAELRSKMEAAGLARRALN